MTDTDQYGRRTITIDEFHEELIAQGVPSTEDLAFVCPACGTIQSARDLIAAGAGDDFHAVEPFLAFSCSGRGTDAVDCDWTLGGLFQIHTLTVITPDLQRHPRFEPATPEQTQAHAALLEGANGATS
jgi:hypothetical protein